MKDEFVGKRVIDIICGDPEAMAEWAIVAFEALSEAGSMPDEIFKRMKKALVATLLKEVTQEEFEIAMRMRNESIS